MSRLVFDDLWTPLRRRLSRLKAVNRAFDRHLASLDHVPRHPEQPLGPHDVILCGSPRSGTTLLAAQLFQPPGVITLMEPWDGLRLPPAELFAEVRANLAAGRAHRGRLDVTVLREEGRVAWVEEGDGFEVADYDDESLVAIKWPTWWQYLEHLPDTRFVVTVRHPHETIDSYERSGGHLREGRDYPVAMNRALNREVARRAGYSLAARRVALYEVVNRGILPHLGRPNVFTVRYERWFDDADGLRSELSAFLDRDLGPWPAHIRPPAARPISARLAELVRVHAPVAHELGYET